MSVETYVGVPGDGWKSLRDGHIVSLDQGDTWPTPSLEDLPDFFYFSHRGAPVKFPESTMTGYRAAPLRADIGLESDEWALTTGELVINHDATVDRTAAYGVTGTVANMSKTDWDALRIKWPDTADNPSATPVPAAYYDQLLDTFGGKVILSVEAKTGAAFQPLLDSITSRGLQDCVVFNSFSGSQCATAAAQGLYAVQAYSGTSPDYAQLASDGIKGVSILSSNATESECDAAHAEGIKVFTYQNSTTPSRIATLKARGVDGVYSDDIGLSTGLAYRNPSTPLPWEA